MALSKQKQTSYGVPVSYWRIIETNINWDAYHCNVCLAGYVSPEARASGAKPVLAETFVFSGANFPFIGLNFASATLNDVFGAIYGKIKQSKLENNQETNFFADASDVM